ncbi:alpha/beta fold hydrolase [Parahaliea maris]|uniref:Alpha/beta fold hydrolase n=1 Tax=Parahaliea maris TaxID=2716870 RepID=A0A5C8ZU41_9GAMM|nr:alpha/beta hydrolase [Parahaliea maris]TXS92023.1 alpha/beta fold hydrolase [Parahaliea maris]
MATAIRRAYASVGERQVHYRTSGEGPAIVLIHQSPRSSAELLPLIAFLSTEFQVIAPDTPGYGQSDPIAPANSEPGIDEFVDGLVGLFDALGLENPLVFGTHTGAILGLRLAVRFPHRVGALIANGILVNTEAERQDLYERYMPPFLPDWSGSHLTWLWGRNKDQYDFFPWYQHSHEARIHWPVDDQGIHECVMDMMDAGDNYRSGYRAVLDYAIADDIPRLRVPTQLLVARADALSRYVEHFPPLPDGVESCIAEDFEDIPRILAEFARRHADSDVTATLANATPDGPLQRYFQSTPGGELHYLAAGNIDGQHPLLLLHDAGLAADSLEELARALSGQRPVIAPDLPGHGESTAGATATPAAFAGAVLELLESLDVGAFDIVAVGASAACALELQREAPSLVGKLICCNPVLADTVADPDDAASLPDLQVDPSGAHLLRAWHYLRDRALYSSWRHRTADTMRPAARPPKAVELQRDVVALLKSATGLSGYLEAALRYRLADCQQAGAHLAATEDFSPTTLPAGFTSLEASKVRWAKVIMEVLER